MRVAVVHSFYSSASPSGENAMVLDQVARLHAMGHEVEVISRHTDDESERRGYAVGSAWTVATGRGRGGDSELRRFSPDVVHVHNTFPNFGSRWLHDWSDRLVMTTHNFRTVCSNGLLMRDGQECLDCLHRPLLPAVRHRCYRGSAIATVPLAIAASPRGSMRQLARRARRVLALTSGGARVLGEALGRQVDVCPNFVAPGTVHGRHGDRWLFVGRFSHEKGIIELLDRWPPGQEVHLVGTGPLSPQVVTRVRERPEVVLRGELPRHTLMAELGSFAGIVVPSLAMEGLPTVILEALSCGVPVVASQRLALTPDLLAAGVAAPFDPLGDTHSLSEAMRAVRAGGESMRAAARAMYVRHYAPEAWGERINKIYAEVADPS